MAKEGRKVGSSTDESKRKKSSQEPKKDWSEISERDLSEDQAADQSEESIDFDAFEDESGLAGGEVPPAAAGALDHPTYTSMEKKLTESEQLAQKRYDDLLRSKAEFENLKRRMERDLSNAHKFGIEKLVLDLIPVLDGLDQGLDIKDFQEAKGEVLHQVREGMELTYKMLLDTLAKHGIEQIDPEGHPFDPNHHEAISMAEDIDVEPNTVLTVVQKGYILQGRLIRAARVVVSKS